MTTFTAANVLDLYERTITEAEALAELIESSSDQFNAERVKSEDVTDVLQIPAQMADMLRAVRDEFLTADHSNKDLVLRHVDALYDSLELMQRITKILKRLNVLHFVEEVAGWTKPPTTG